MFGYNVNEADIMQYLIRKSERKDCGDIEHIITLGWNETYKGLVPDLFLEELKNNEIDRAKKSFDRFDENNNNQLVLEVGGKVVGFVKYGKSIFDIYENCGEIFALYILKEYHGHGFGRKLVDNARRELKLLGYDEMVIACLKKNPSNEFYKHIGGIYIKDVLYEKLNLLENLYYFKSS